eukprot:TRINITY_DN11591_c0_g1_i1.p1 TRINITY_DN11591_c0_g1~~TRINITY_DN11591_c0_g1_i1.p1  ORF type:complete len:382 (+),score=44.24 TRINITY_DN11591_c0_g1_i1:100-1245(+)
MKRSLIKAVAGVCVVFIVVLYLVSRPAAVEIKIFKDDVPQSASKILTFAAENRTCDATLFAFFVTNTFTEATSGCSSVMKHSNCKECEGSVTFRSDGSIYTETKFYMRPMKKNLRSLYHTITKTHPWALSSFQYPVELPFHSYDDVPEDTGHSIMLHHSIRHDSICSGVITSTVHDNLFPREMEDLIAAGKSRRYKGKNYHDYIHSRLPWHLKNSVAVWRGHNNGPWRKRLVKLCKSRKMKSWCDASFDFMSWEEVTQHKYIISCGGWSYAGLVHPALQSGSLLLMQQGVSHVWYEKYLQPMVHYLPVNKDFSNLKHMISWAQQHDAEAQKIAQNAKLLTDYIFSKETIWCYTSAAFHSAFFLKQFATKIEHQNTISAQEP